jgi:hypothetical protein
MIDSFIPVMKVTIKRIPKNAQAIADSTISPITVRYRPCGCPAGATRPLYSRWATNNLMLIIAAKTMLRLTLMMKKAFVKDLNTRKTECPRSPGTQRSGAMTVTPEPII